MNNSIILPGQSQITGDYMTSRLVDKDNQAAQVTDFALLLGTYKNARTGTGPYWARNSYNYAMLRSASIMSYEGLGSETRCNNRGMGIRPVLLLSSVPMPEIKENNGVKEVEYGEYPQTIVDPETAKKLEEELYFGGLNKTGKTYTTDTNDFRFGNKLKPRNHEEYEYEGSRYVRVVATNIDDNNGMLSANYTNRQLSDGTKVEVGQAYWIKVEPIKWILSDDGQMITSKNIIVGGVRIGNRKEFNGYEEDTILRQFLDNYLAKDIISKKDYLNTQQEEVENKISSLENKRDVVLDIQESINMKIQEFESIKQQLIQTYSEKKITDEQYKKLVETIDSQLGRLNAQNIELNAYKQVFDSIIGTDEIQSKKIS